MTPYVIENYPVPGVNFETLHQDEFAQLVRHGSRSWLRHRNEPSSDWSLWIETYGDIYLIAMDVKFAALQRQIKSPPKDEIIQFLKENMNIDIASNYDLGSRPEIRVSISIGGEEICFASERL